MFTSGASTVSQVCLRCQLRCIILRARPWREVQCINLGVRSERALRFSTTCLRRDDEHVSGDDASSLKPDYMHRRPLAGRNGTHRPLRRLVGAPGKRQRPDSAQLKINSLERPFEVIVMRDIREPQPITPEMAGNGQSISAGQIETAISAEAEEPSQLEVYNSIDAMRPNSLVVSEDEFQILSKNLAKGYNQGQLTQYLDRALEHPTVKADLIHLRHDQASKPGREITRSTWRAGRTRLNKRHTNGTVVKRSGGADKSQLVARILRQVWNLSMSMEEQRMGELEMSLHPWQIRYLFDLSESEVFKYSAAVDSSLLLQASEIRPYRPNSIVRISARRHDATEIANRLENELKQVSNLTMPLAFVSSLLGQAGPSSARTDLFQQDDILEVEKRTQTVITLYGGSVVIRGKHAEERYQAQRMLLSLLQLPKPGATTLLTNLTTSRNQALFSLKPSFISERASFMLRSLHRQSALCRLSAPINRKVDPERRKAGSSGKSKPSESPSEQECPPQSPSQSVPKRICTALAGAKALRQVVIPTAEQTSWRLAPHADWEVRFCSLLRPETGQAVASGKRPGKKARRRQQDAPIAQNAIGSIVGPEVPGLMSFLTYLKPKAPNGDELPELVARFMPSPFTERGIGALGKFPRVRLTYHHLGGAQDPDVRLKSLEAILESQDFHVPLPEEAIDIRFVKKTVLHRAIAEIPKEDNVHQFTDTLRQSVRGGRMLSGKFALDIKLPASVAGDSTEGDKDLPVQYLFEKFEEVQQTDFVAPPSVSLKEHPDVAHALSRLGPRSVLSLAIIHGGFVGGKRQSLTLSVPPRPTPPAASEDESVSTASDESLTVQDFKQKRDEDRDSLLQKAEAALAVVRVFTGINAGELNATQKGISL